MHMWQLELSSPGEEGEWSGAGSPEGGPTEGVTSSKLFTVALPLPAGTEVVQCVPDAGHLSSLSEAYSEAS
jgi:hypothetical protein